jgi:AcrR family transcriptional regulator
MSRMSVIVATRKSELGRAEPAVPAPTANESSRPVAGIDERLLLGGSLAYETAHYSRDGLGGTTLDRVAAEGRISKMTLYRHFPSKEALFEGLVTAMCEYMREGLENAPPANVDKPAAKRLADELRAFTSALIEPDALALYRLIVADGWRFPDLSRVFDQSGMRIIRRRIAQLLESGGVPANKTR